MILEIFYKFEFVIGNKFLLCIELIGLDGFIIYLFLLIVDIKGVIGFILNFNKVLI